jgi:hypothetical protein
MVATSGLKHSPLVDSQGETISFSAYRDGLAVRQKSGAPEPSNTSFRTVPALRMKFWALSSPCFIPWSPIKNAGVDANRQPWMNFDVAER